MSVGRHSYIAFYPSDWLAGTARMNRVTKSVYHDICVYNWDKARPAPAAEVELMLLDLPDGAKIIDLLVNSGSLQRTEDGALFSERALAEAEKAFGLWEKKSAGGRAKRVLKESSEDSSREPYPEPTIPVGPPAGAAELAKEIFEVGVKLLMKAGRTERSARELIGKLRKGRQDANVLMALVECETAKVSDPAAWLTKRLQGARYVSASGHEYRGTLEQIKKEALRRGDNNTYWQVCADEKNATG